MFVRLVLIHFLPDRSLTGWAPLLQMLESYGCQQIKNAAVCLQNILVDVLDDDDDDDVDDDDDDDDDD